MRRSFASLILVLIIACTVWLQPVPAIAAAAGAAGTGVPANGTSRRGGVTISPAFQQIAIEPGQDSRSFDFKVTNNSDQEYEFGLSVVDFGSLDETGGVLFVGNAQKALSYRYALSPWVTLEKDRVVVGPHATEKVPITIENKESLTPGGHYGAVLVSPTDSNDADSKKVQIDEVASSLLFVKKIGGDVYKLNLSNFTVRPHIFSLPGKVSLRFQNGGNVHLIPHGLVTLTDPRGRVVKRGVINADSGIVLPETFRSLDVPLDPVASSWLPGKYKLTAVYRYDEQTTTRSVTTSFVYLNLLFLFFVLIILAILITLIASRKLRRIITNSLDSALRRAKRIVPKKY